MTTKEFSEKYNLHDSLLESMEVDRDNQTVKLTVDFCYWQQEWYDDRKHETGIIMLVFSGLTDITYDNYTLHSDSIISCEADNEKIVLQVESDITCSSHAITILAKNVEIFAEYEDRTAPIYQKINQK